MSVNLWLKLIQDAIVDDEPSGKLSSLFTLDIQNPQISSLQNNLWDSNLNIDSLVDSCDLYDGEWPGFVELVKTYLTFCKNVDPNDLKASYDLYAAIVADLQLAFTNSKGAVLSQTVITVSKQVIPLASKFDSDTDNASFIRIGHIASTLLKIFNNIRALKPERNETATYCPSPGTATNKKDIILYVAVTLCRLYSRMGQMSLCANVFSNIHTAKLHFAKYSMSQQVEYRFYLGRYYLLKNQLANSYCHLYWSFMNCYGESWKNQRLILIYLIPAAMLLGKLPTDRLLGMYDLQDAYGPIRECIKTPDFGMMKRYLQDRQQWLQSRSLYMLLTTKSIIIMLRTLFYKLYRAKNKSNTVSFEDIFIALELAKWPFLQNDISNDNGHDRRTVENICISLISQGLTKGNIFTRTKVVRLKAIDPLPRLANLYRIEGSEPIPVGDREKWMEN